MLVSIYMPTKNRVDSLAIAVNSVLSQSHQEFELIIVDDGSTDATPDYLKQIASQDTRVKYFRNETSKGACHARNLAIMSATGDFITGLDDDDEFTKNHISGLLQYWNMMSEQSLQPFSCVYSQDMRRTGNVLERGNKSSRVECHDLLDHNGIGNQIFAPKEHYVKAGLFDEAMPAWQDMELFYRMIKLYGPARLLDINSYVFDVTPRPDRISVGKKTAVMEACARMTKLHGNNDPRVAQMFLLQAYGDYYNFNVTLLDYLKFCQLSFWPRGYKNLAKIVLRRKYRDLKRKIQSSLPAKSSQLGYSHLPFH